MKCYWHPDLDRHFASKMLSFFFYQAQSLFLAKGHCCSFSQCYQIHGWQSSNGDQWRYIGANPILIEILNLQVFLSLFYDKWLAC
jgi:hypothetical protein